MIEPSSNGRRREARLLLATIAVSVGMLLLLARFRFPEEAARQTVEPAPAPLERLAARATYEELAAVMADLERRILPSVFALGAQGPDGMRYVPAVRVTADRAVVLMPSDRKLASVDGTAVPSIVLRDPTTELAVVQTAAQPQTVAIFPSAAARPGPRYVAVAEAVGGVVAIRPVYIGRTDLFSDARWPDQLISVAAVQQTLSSGSAVFSLDGTFIGLAIDAGGGIAIVRSSTLRAAAAGTLAAPAVRGDLPIEVQPLSATLAEAAGAAKGVMVSRLWSSLPGEVPIAPGDVIQSVDGIEVTSVAGFQQVAQSRSPGAKVVLRLVRKGKPASATVLAIEADAQAPGSPDSPGVSLRNVQGLGVEVVTVEPSGPASRAGLRQGDVIVTLDYATAPAAQDIARAFRSAKPGTLLLLTVQRDGTHRVLALEKR
jgi:S1-C subfamily serine protease